MNSIILKTIQVLFIFLLFRCNNSKHLNFKEEHLNDFKFRTIDTVGNFLFISLEKINDGRTFNYESSKKVNKPHTVEIHDSIYYVVEGDLLMRKNEYYQYRTQLREIKAFDSVYGINKSGPKIRGFRIDGDIIKQREHSNMKYAIDKSSFGENLKEYDIVKDNMYEASRNWEGICDVKFIHLQHLDSILEGRSFPEELTFVIRKIANDNGVDLAFSFLPLPSLPKYEKNIFITSTYFSDTTYDKVGVFRHEIGHTLGFLHEHVMSSDLDCKEPSVYNIIRFPPYDQKSIMHYFCNGIGDKELKFTYLDSLGAFNYYPIINQN